MTHMVRRVITRPFDANQLIPADGSHPGRLLHQRRRVFRLGERGARGETCSLTGGQRNRAILINIDQFFRTVA
jgi:hypothetical protein